MALTKVIGSGIDTVFVDAGNDKIGINTNAPNRMLGIENGDVQIHETGSSDPLLQFSVGNTQASPTQSYSLRIDNSDSDKFQLINGTSGEIALSVDTTGAITKPKQPAFLAHPASTITNINTGANNGLVFGTERFDNNADYNNSTGVFTAPVTGKYMFNVSFYLNNIDQAANYYEPRLDTSNRSYYIIFDPDFGQDNSYFTVTFAQIVDMDANDTADINIHQDGGSSQTDISSNSMFSMYLVC